uniref:Uncharacterized protein n=1 Tax=Anopheles farauti TaxID=69004 RepID=A0A182QLP6_9DIPT
MSSVNVPKKARNEPRALLRSTSFQKLCSIPYSFKIEAIQSYKEHLKTVIKLLKIATRAYVISVYFKFITTLFFHEYILTLCSALKGLRSEKTDSKTTEYDCSDSAFLKTPKTKATPGWNGKSEKPVQLDLILTYKTAVQTILTYTCIVYIGLQTIFLLAILCWSSNIPFGLVFLMLDLSYIGFIMSKVKIWDSGLLFMEPLPE